MRTIAANSEFRERKTISRALHLEDIDGARSHFSKRIDLINQFRNEFGGHLDQKAISSGLTLLAAGTAGSISRERISIGNFILQHHYATTILQASVLNKLKPGIDLDQETDAVIHIIAKSINHTQRQLRLWFMASFGDGSGRSATTADSRNGTPKIFTPFNHDCSAEAAELVPVL